MFHRPPFVMGYDVVGEIDQLGDGVNGFQIGDCVADMTVVGSNAAYRTLRAKDLARVPAGVDPAEAAALILSWTTAYQLLHRSARAQPGQRALVHDHHRDVRGGLHAAQQTDRDADRDQDRHVMTPIAPLSRIRADRSCCWFTAGDDDARPTSPVPTSIWARSACQTPGSDDRRPRSTAKRSPARPMLTSTGTRCTPRRPPNPHSAR